MLMGFRRDAAGYWIEKDPNSILDFALDWADWLDGDTITSSSFTVAAGLTKQSEDFDLAETVVWLAGGTVGQVYNVTNHITTALGRVVDRSFRVVVREQ
jgi:uncharacterized protein (DUF697 family)